MDVEKKNLPENLLKRQTRDQKIEAAKAKVRAEKKANGKQRRQALINKAKDYAKEYAQADREIIEKKRAARAQGGFYIPAEAKVLLVVRIRGILPDFSMIFYQFFGGSGLLSYLLRDFL